MKKYILLSLITLFFLVSSFAQSIGINNDGSLPNASAMLDVKNPNKGVLIPRVSLTGTGDATTIASPAVSLLVYNTATTIGATAVSPGYYYWSGLGWLRIKHDSWLLSGNAGTIDGNNFIGTTDNIPFNIKVNNYRLISVISHDWTVILTCVFLTHTEYDRANWQETCRCGSED